jgi:hypothetical protein
VEADEVRRDVGILVAIVAVVVVVLLVPSACAPQGLDLPSETIVKEVGGGSNSIQIERPLLRVAANAEEMAELKALTDQLGHGAGPDIEWSFDERLDEVDLSTHLVIAAFQGRKNTGGYRIEVVSVRQSGNQVYVIADFVTPTPGKPVTLAVTSPYHVIKVKQADLARKGRITFILMNTSGRAVAKTVQEVR